MEPVALTVAEVAKVTPGLGRDSIYKEIKARRLRAVKRGRSTLILVEDLKKYLTSLPAIAPQVAEPRPPRRRRAKSA